MKKVKDGVSSTESVWAIKGDDETEGVQIDLLINRKDNVVNLCEKVLTIDALFEK